MKKTWKSKLRNFSKTWAFSILVALVVATSFRSAIADWNDVPTGSMQPTILIGDRIFVNKLAYDLKIPFTTTHVAKWGDPKRFEIVVFYSPEDGKRLVKRVIGLPGETVAMYRNQLFIDRKPIQYEVTDKKRVQGQGIKIGSANSDRLFYIEKFKNRKHPVMFWPGQPSMSTFRPVKIPEDHYFMMGDNRDNSADSRFFGCVPRNSIIGRASAVALSREGSFLHPRWNRFFKKLM